MRNLVIGCLTLMIGLAAGAVGADAASVTGSWAGSGKVKLKTGQVEPIRCRIRYEESSGRTFVMTVNCAHANGTFKQSGRVVKKSASRYTGRLYSQEYGVSGDISITVNGKSQTLRAKSAKGTASITLRRK